MLNCAWGSVSAGGRVLTVTGTATLAVGVGARGPPGSGTLTGHVCSSRLCPRGQDGTRVQAGIPTLGCLPCAAERLGTFFRATRS